MNTVRFVQEGQSLAPQHHHFFLGQDLLKYTTRSEETNVNFEQPVQSSDRITIQYEEDANGTPVLQLLDRLGNVYHTFAAPTTQTIAGNYKPGTLTQMYSYQWSVRLDQISSFDEGLYKLRLTPADSSLPKRQSEWMDVRTDHPDTIYFRYNHSISDHNTLFDSTFNPRFAYRTFGTIKRPTHDSDSTSFDDQEKELTQLSSHPFRKYRFIVGDPSNGVPDIVNEQLNWIFSCDEVSMDGLRISKESDAKWELTEIEGYSNRGFALDVRESEVMNPYIQTNGFFPFFTIPAYPFFIKSLTMSDGVGTVIVCINQFVLDATALATLITDLNTTTAVPIYDLEGTFSNTSGVLGYNNAVGENYNSYSANYLEKYIKLTYDCTNIALPYTFGFYNGTIGIYWGQAGFTASYNGTAAIQNISFTSYSGTGTKTIYIFHNDAVTGFVSTLNNANKVTNIEGLFPINCTGVNISNQNIASLSPDIFKPAEPNLASLILTSSHFTGFTNDFFQWGTLWTYHDLIWIQLAGNELSTAYVDAWINDMAFKDYISPGLLHLQLQTPLAPPTVASATMKADLITFGWSVSTD